MAGFAPPPVTEDRYPEHTKLVNNNDRTQTVNDFFEWLKETHPGHELAVWRTVLMEDDALYPLSKNEYDNLLAEWIGVDLKKIEAEKQAMIDELRSKQ